MAGLLSLDPVSEALRQWAETPFIWGDTDCAHSVLAYIERVTGRVAPPTVSRPGRSAAFIYLRERGGLTAACEDMMRHFEAWRIGSAERGDVGLVNMPISGLTACLCPGPGMWAAKGEREVVIIPARPVVAWRLPCPRP